MKKLNLTLLATIVITFTSFAQSVSINTTGATAHASAMLDIAATDKGILIPRVANPATIASPATGLLAYSTTSNTFWYYNGSV